VSSGSTPEAGRPHSATGARPVSLWGFTGVAVTALGGPLALAALYAPSIASGASSSAGLAMVAAAVVFSVPIWIWLSYAREVSAPGGLYGFVEAAAGRPVALAQAGLWTISYLLYLVYTTAQIVYDTLPAVLPGERRYQTLLEIAIPVAIAAVMIAGRRVTLIVAGLLAAGQLAIAGALGGLTLANIDTPLSTFGASARAGSLAIASGQTALLYICGSLPFFLSGDLLGGTRQPPRPPALTASRRRIRLPGGTPGKRWDPARLAVSAKLPPRTAAPSYSPVGEVAGAPATLPVATEGKMGTGANPSFRLIRTGLLTAYVATVVVIIAAVAPLAAIPGFTKADIPGMAVARAFGGHGFGVTVGIGVAASVAGVILVEYLALSRLATAVTAWPLRPVIIGIGVIMVGFAPIMLINPDKIYDSLITPSLVALWLSQLVVFAVYPRFAARRTKRALPAWTLAVTASAFAVYGLWTTIQVSST
jgi:hypothetical protein